MNPIAFVVLIFALTGVGCLFLGMGQMKAEKALNASRELGNLNRRRKARSVGPRVYIHEDYDGSLLWRDAPTR